jgi:glycosyltransferase involved in cell wall biosynthesis
MNIAFLWTGVTGPMVSCWKALAAQPGVRVKVFVELARRDDSAFDHVEMLDGLDSAVLFAVDYLDQDSLRLAVRSFEPDVIIAIGWRSQMVRSIVESAEFARVAKIFAFDMPFAWSLRKLVAPIILRRYLRRFVAALVPGERSARYARHLGFRPDQIETGLISLDTGPFLAADQKRRSKPAYPRSFLYVGRYAPEKRIDVLVEAYRQYRKQARIPWDLACCGMGPLARLLAGQEGVTDLGFVQPGDLPAVYAAHGAFVITSDYEPWGMVIAEAAAAGLPIICTDACGARLEVVRPGENGIVCANGDTAAISSAMKWIDDHEQRLPVMGSRSLELVTPFNSQEWVQRVLRRCRQAIQIRIDDACSASST